MAVHRRKYALPYHLPGLFGGWRGKLASARVSADIGAVGVAGSADETSGTFTLDGAGADIGGTVDAFHYVYQSLSGDGEIIANVASLTGGGSTPKAGVMIRESLADDAIQVSALIRGNRIRVYERTTTGGNTTELNGANNGAPEWLRLERTGNTFDLYNSNNGTSWTLMQSRTVTMGTNVYIGLAVTGNSTTTLATGTFDNVTVTGGGGGGPTPTFTPTPTNTPTAIVPEPTPTFTPTPTPTPPPPPPSGSETIVQRTTYSIAGQAVFLRVRTLEDNVETDNRLYALHSDHLGSTSTLSYLNPADGTASRVLDSRAFYTPFGDYRLEPTGDYTDWGYTGHLHNNSGSNDIGLIYMNARFYVSGIGRFASADTIVPDPGRPQSFNRYSYGYNNPVKYFDPTGHIACEVLGTEECNDDGSFVDAPMQQGIQYDLTSWLGSEMLVNLFSEELSLVIEFMTMEMDPQIAAYMVNGGGSGFLAAQGAWFELTRDYGAWDLKREMRRLIGEEIVLCGDTSCGWFDYSVPGNIHYGFLAAAAGIPREESYWAAGLLELVGSVIGDGDPGDFSTRYENPADKAAVDLGYDLFDTHGYGFVPNDLRTALTPAVMSTLQKPPNIPAVAAEPQVNRYPIGAFNYGQ